MSEKVLGKGGFDRVLLLPHSPLTFWAVLKAFLVQIFTFKRVSVIGLQPWEYTAWQKVLLRRMGSVEPWVQSRRNQENLERLGFKAGFLSAGVDEQKFCPVSPERKVELRREYGVPLDRRVVLHVGHVRPSRNLEWLMAFAQAGYHVVMIGSTYRHTDFGQDEEVLEKRLREAGVDLRMEYCEHIEHYYQLADLYLFPVQDHLGAIEMPLSVFESLACKVPVISTHFGGLESVDDLAGLVWADSCHDAVSAAEDVLSGNPSDRPFASFSWDQVFMPLFDR